MNFFPSIEPYLRILYTLLVIKGMDQSKSALFLIPRIFKDNVKFTIFISLLLHHPKLVFTHLKDMIFARFTLILNT